MAFNHKYNTDKSIIRANIVGLVNELNQRIQFENVWEDDKVQVVRVPFFYAMSGDERFLQTYFSDWSDCAPDFIEGNTDPIPRGTLSLTGYSVLASNLTSRYVRGYYTKVVDGQLKRFNSYINSIPVQLNFSAEILVDTSIDSFAITESITAFLYRTQTYSVNYKGFRVPTQVGFPDTYTIGKQFEFTYGNTERLKISFDLEVQSYLPVVDEANEFFGGNQISSTSANVNPEKSTNSSGGLGGSDTSLTLGGLGDTTTNATGITVDTGSNTSTTTFGTIDLGMTGASGTQLNNYTSPSTDAGSGNLSEGSLGQSPGTSNDKGERNDNQSSNDANDEYDGGYWE